MCSPHGGCPGIDVEAGRKLAAENDRLFKLLERMIDQMLPVEELKDMPGYNRVLTAETLLVERDQLKAENEVMAEFKAHMVSLRETHGFDSWAAALVEIDKLRKDADRYRWLRDRSESIHQFYLSTPIWFTGVKFSKENVDDTIDDAMSKDAASEA